MRSEKHSDICVNHVWQWKHRRCKAALAAVMVIAAFLFMPVQAGWAGDRSPTHETHAYRQSAGSDFDLDIYGLSGAAAAPKRPALVFFHGGSWSGGDKHQFARQAKLLTERTRLIVISVDYPTNRNPVESTNAALAAVCWVRTNAGRFGIDLGRLAVAGGSAGGQLAAAVALVGDRSIPECAGARRPYANALVLLNPVLDLKGKWERKLGLSLAEVSPIDLIDSSLPPTLILQGTSDRTTPVGIARAFVAKAKASGVDDIQLIEYPGRRHGFFNRTETGDLGVTVNDIIHFLRHLGWL